MSIDQLPCPPAPKTRGDLELEEVYRKVAALHDGESIVLRIPRGLGDLNSSRAAAKTWFRGPPRKFERLNGDWYVDGSKATMWLAYGHLSDDSVGPSGAVQMARKLDRRSGESTYAPELAKLA